MAKQTNQRNSAAYLSNEWAEMKNAKIIWDGLLTDVYKYCDPNKKDMYSDTRGEDQFFELFDTSAIHYAELLASALHSMLTNPSVQWFELTTGIPELDKKPEVRDFLQKTVRKIHQILNNSNFQTEIHSLYLDLAVAGTGVLRIEKDDTNKIRFSAKPIHKYGIKENSVGLVDTVYQEYELTIRQAKQEFGEDFHVGNIKLTNLANAGKDEEKITILHAVMPRKDAKFGKLDPKNKAIASQHVFIDGENSKMLKEEGFDTFPYAVPRWIKASGEIRGRSPSMKCLPDVKMLNQIMKTTIRSAQKIVDPPLMFPDDMKLRPNTRPGGGNPYRAGRPDDRIYPLVTGGRIDLGLELMTAVRDRIKESYFIDQLQLREGPQMTATEVNQRTEEHLRLLGPILGRLHFELLQPMIARVMDILKEDLPEAPEELAKISPEIYFSSQIARAQRIGEAQSLDRFMQTMAGLVQIDPTIYDLLATEDYVAYNANLFGVPQEIFRDEEGVKQIREQRAQQQQEQQQRDAAQQESETVKNVAGMGPQA